MEYALLGQSGLVVSRLSFGAMSFMGEAKPRPIWKADADTAERMIAASLDAGINFFDTADAYAEGQSELLLGRALKGKRDAAIIATKVGFRTGKPLVQAGLSPRHIHWSVDQSLKRLDTDWIDLLIVHREDPLTPMEVTLEALDQVVRAGKVRAIGFSNWSAWRVAAAITHQRANGLAQFCHGQVYWSLVGRDAEHTLVPMARHFAIGLTVWSPLAGGFLSGKYHRDGGGGNGRRAQFDFPPIDQERGFDIVDLLREAASALGATPAQVALAWLLGRPGMTSAIVGASTTAQLDDNLGAATLHLPDDVVERLDAASAPAKPYPNWWTDEMNEDAMIAAVLTR